MQNIKRILVGGQKHILTIQNIYYGITKKQASVMINWANSSYFMRSSKRARLQQNSDSISTRAKRLLIVWWATLCFLRTLVISALDRKYSACLTLFLQSLFWHADLRAIKQSASCRIPLQIPSSAPPTQSCESFMTMLESTAFSHENFSFDIELLLF